MLSVPSRAYDNTFLNSIEGYRGNINKIGRLLLHDWWTVVDKEGKAHERYLFLFKSRVLICKVRKINEKRSIFVLQEIIKIPDCVVEEDSANSLIKFTAKAGAKDTQHLPLCLKPHGDDKSSIHKWYTEICTHIDKEVTLQEHKADDLRIDSSQILQETVINLPQKAEAYNPDTSIRASDVAKDYFLSKEEKERYQAEYQELLKLEQESIERYNKTKLESYQTVQKTSVSNRETTQQSEIQQRSEFVSKVSQRLDGVEQKVSVQSQAVEQQERVVIKNDNIVEAQRSTNVSCSQESKTEVSSQEIATQTSIGSIQQATQTQEQIITKPSPEPVNETVRESAKLTKEPSRESPKPKKDSPKPQEPLKVNEDTPKPQELPKEEITTQPKKDSPKPQETPKVKEQTPPKPKKDSPKPQEPTQSAEPKRDSPKPKRESPKLVKEEPQITLQQTTLIKEDVQEEQRKEISQTITNITTESEILPPSYPVEEIDENLGKNNNINNMPTKALDANPAFTPEPLPVPQIKVTQDIVPRIHKPIQLQDIVGYQESIRQATGGDQNPSGSGGQQNVYNISDSASLMQWNNRLYTIQMGGGDQGAGSEPPQPPMPPHSVRMPGFFQPLPRISYETSIEILIVKAPPPPPPPPITLIPRVVVLNDALELKSQNFLEGIYETDSFDTSLRTAKKKIRSIKSTVLKSKDSTKYAVDTVKKAEARDFVHIFTPPIKQKRPIYEIVEEPSRLSDVEDEFSESMYGDLHSEIREHSVARTEDHLSVTSRRRYDSKNFNPPKSVSPWVLSKIWKYFVKCFFVYVICCQQEIYFKML